MAPITVLEPEALYPDDSFEQPIFGGRVALHRGGGLGSYDTLPKALSDEAEGLFVFRNWLTAEDLARFPKLKVVVRLGVGYDRVDRAACAARGIKVCNVPDYGTSEIADHAIAMTLALRRGLLLHHDVQRSDPPAAWNYLDAPVIRRLNVQNFGIVGLGRIGTAVALRAKALGFKVFFYDPKLPNGVDRALGINRCRSLQELLPQSDVLSLHCLLTRETKGLIGAAELAQLPKDAVLINTARGPVLDLDAVEANLRSGHLAGAGLDVLPVEPVPLPEPPLLQAYRAREEWLRGRLIVTPHSAFHAPESLLDIRVKGAETMRDVLLDGLSTNVIPPESD
ncbi:phosphoglycerate dehydrogenase [Pseudoroseomonas deserti]|uniref:Phosphoglycerate dehydrogenase n=1 Tax=Teichococcus deserti TaxID=1817963 RepID=A0A1V2GUI1_9PROT|nr:C-terminal binding protein [Pseudoroseomonas deserti]ONG45371.1 phosphoglycerate dehydrogenase [Pseudoroseomonas deserti]